MRQSIHRVVTPCEVITREGVDHPVEQVEQGEGCREHDPCSPVDVGHAVYVASHTCYKQYHTKYSIELN